MKSKSSEWHEVALMTVVPPTIRKNMARKMLAVFRNGLFHLFMIQVFRNADDAYRKGFEHNGTNVFSRLNMFNMDHKWNKPCRRLGKQFLKRIVQIWWTTGTCQRFAIFFLIRQLIEAEQEPGTSMLWKKSAIKDSSTTQIMLIWMWSLSTVGTSCASLWL